MSENARELRPQFGFLSAVGLFFLAVLAVLVALYFYNADIRQAGDGAIDHARAYKQTIVSDYSRFYECMRGVAPTSSHPVKAESVSGAPGVASAPVVVYPPYADYPTYPGYHEGGAPVRPDSQAAAMQPPLPGHHGATGPTPGLPEYARPESGSQAVPGAPVPGGQTDFGMQAGPVLPAGPGIHAAPGAPMPGMDPQASPSMRPGPSMEPGPIMQAGPGNQPGSEMQPAPAMHPGSGMQAYQGSPAAPGMYPRPMMPQGYPPAASWQNHGMSPSGMPPSGMAAPMPHGQGQSMAAPQPPARAQGPAGMPGAGPNYAMAPGGPGPYGPQGSLPPTPWSRYGHGMPGFPGAAEGGSGIPTVIPATPTMPITSMMPPPGDAAPVLPGEARQIDPQIAAARQAAANQQHQEAIQLYRNYLSRNGSDPSAFGELGNVLLSAGRPQEAAQAYYEASSRLIDVGQPGTVYLLLPHIEQHDPLLGAVLMRRLASLPRSIY